MKKTCSICAGEHFDNTSRCETCANAMRTCDRQTYDLVLGLLRRIELLEKRVREAKEVSS